MKKIEKNLERISSNISNVLHKIRESTESTSSELFFSFPCQKKLKKPWGQGWVETKLLELNHFLDKKKITKWTAILNWEALVWYKNLSIKTLLKNCPIFFVCNRSRPLPLLPKSVASGVYRLSSNNSENTVVFLV